MYPVTQDFLDKMKADRRHIVARAVIDYTDPFIDQSIEIEASEQANVSYPQQTADNVDTATHKWASLDGSSVLDGTYHLAPGPDKLMQYQFGWWGKQLAGAGGVFLSPYPSLTVTHLPRPIRQLKVVGDTAREEYPVDFNIKLYAQNGTLLKTETVTGNTQVSWQKNLEPQVLDVAKQVLEITKWSHAGRCAKIVEFFTSIREVYETGDLISIRLLEEREASQGSLPVGNISSNEITLALSNADKKFDIDNENSPLKNLLKPNRRIHVWLGLKGGGEGMNIQQNVDFSQGELNNLVVVNNKLQLPDVGSPSFSRNSTAYLSDGALVNTNLPRFEPGRFGNAIMVEEGTTNLLVKNLGTGGPGSIIDILVPNKVWAKRITVEANNYFYFGEISVPAQPNTKYTLTYWARLVSGSVVTGTQIYIGSDSQGTSGVALLRIDAELTSEWKKFVITGQTDANATTLTRATFRVQTNTGCTVEIADWQLEAKPYPTSFIDGTRSAETLTIPTAGVLNPQEGTIEFWWNPLAKTPQTYPSLIATGRWTSPITQDWLAIYWGSGWSNANTVTFAMHNKNGTNNFNMSVALNPQQYTWYYVVAKWSFVTRIAKLIIYRPDGTYVSTQATINGEPPTFEGWDKFYILQAWNNGPDRANSLIDDLRISSRARSDAEILAAYQSGQPLPVDEWTTYKLNFDGNLNFGQGGSYISPEYDLSAVGTAATSAITWQEDPDGIQRSVYAKLDNQADWTQVVNGGKLPINTGDVLTGRKLQLKTTHIKAA